MNVTEVVNQVGTGLPWMTVGGFILWLIQRWLASRAPILPPLLQGGPVAAASPALDWLRQIRTSVASALALFRLVPGNQPDEFLAKLLSILDSLLGTPGIELRNVTEVKALVAERLKA